MTDSSNKRMSVSKEQLMSDLRQIGLADGDHVAVAISFKSIGFVEGGAETFIDALLDVVGSKGTILMNTHSRFFAVSEISSDYLFDYKKSAPTTGALPQKLLNRNGSIRSLHPTFSVVAIGALAEYLTEGHDEFSNPYLPFEKLAEVRGKCLFIGLNGRLVAVRHEAQRRAGLFIVPMLAGCKYKNRNGETKLFVFVMPPCVNQLPALNPKLEAMHALTLGKIGSAVSCVGFADTLLDSLSKMLKADPSLNLCDDHLCLSCRELERRLNLYDSTGKKSFQKILKQAINFNNKLVLICKYSRIRKLSKMEKLYFMMTQKILRLISSVVTP